MASQKTIAHAKKMADVLKVATSLLAYDRELRIIETCAIDCSAKIDAAVRGVNYATGKQINEDQRDAFIVGAHYDLRDLMIRLRAHAVKHECSAFVIAAIDTILRD